MHRPENHTLLGGTNSFRLNKGVFSPPPPPQTLVVIPRFVMFCGNENYHSPWLLNISMSLYIVSEVSLCLVAHYVLRGFCGPCAKGTGVVTWRDRSFPLQGPSFLTNLLSPLSSNIDDNDTSLYINTTSLTLTLQFKQ